MEGWETITSAAVSIRGNVLSVGRVYRESGKWGRDWRRGGGGAGNEFRTCEGWKDASI